MSIRTCRFALDFQSFSRIAFALVSVSVLLSAAFLYADSSKGIVTFQKGSDNIITLSVDGEFFAQFRPDADVGCKGALAPNWNGMSEINGTPIIWPICSAGGTLMTRGFPMDSVEDTSLQDDPVLKNIFENSKIDTLTAEKDHVHHRSLWFNHGEVNGINFWGPDAGRIVMTSIYSITEELHSVTIVTDNAWIPEKGAAPLCTDRRTITFGVLADSPEIRYIDYDVTVTAAADEVLFADTKEGSFGYRIPGSMDVTAKNRSESWGGHILNSSNEEDDAAWGKRASWVDYYGPVPKRLTDAELLTADSTKPDTFPLTSAGVDIMNHPKSFRYPSWYHVRTYGLFAVNPFGISDFDPDSRISGDLNLKKGESFSVNYRILIHDDPLSFDELESLFDDYKSISK